MRAWIALLVIATAALAYVPAASAHSCQGTSCGPCVKGEMHQHQDVHGQCTSGPGYFTNQGYTGQEAQVPGPGLALTLVGAGLAVALVARRRL